MSTLKLFPSDIGFKRGSSELEGEAQDNAHPLEGEDALTSSMVSPWWEVTFPGTCTCCMGGRCLSVGSQAIPSFQELMPQHSHMWFFFIIFLMYLSTWGPGLCPELPSLADIFARPWAHAPVKKKSNYLFASSFTSGYLSRKKEFMLTEIRMDQRGQDFSSV